MNRPVLSIPVRPENSWSDWVNSTKTRPRPSCWSHMIHLRPATVSVSCSSRTDASPRKFGGQMVVVPSMTVSSRSLPRSGAISMTFASLAGRNIRRHVRTYVSYLLSQTFSVMVFYVFMAIYYNRQFFQLSQDSIKLSLIHISEPTRLGMISYAVFCLKKKKHERDTQPKSYILSPTQHAKKKIYKTK